MGNFSEQNWGDSPERRHQGQSGRTRLENGRHRAKESRGVSELKRGVMRTLGDVHVGVQVVRMRSGRIRGWAASEVTQETKTLPRLAPAIIGQMKVDSTRRRWLSLTRSR